MKGALEELSYDVPRLKKISSRKDLSRAVSEKKKSNATIHKVEGLFVKTQTHAHSHTHTHAPCTDAWEGTACTVNRVTLSEGYTGEEWCRFPFIVLFCLKMFLQYL